MKQELESNLNLEIMTKFYSLLLCSGQDIYPRGGIKSLKFCEHFPNG